MSRAVCAIELSLDKAKNYRKDLKNQKIQTLIFVDQDEEKLSSLQKFYAEDKGVYFFAIRHFCDLELKAQEIAWRAVGLLLAIELGGSQEFYSSFVEKVKKFHLQVTLLLSDSSDFGLMQMKEHLAKDFSKKVRHGLYLKDRFSKIPAIIVGAGPSLQKEKLLEFQDRALIFAGGNALLAIDQAPHFAALVDPKDLYQEMKKFAYQETPFLFSSRVSSKHFSLMHGEAVWFPDSHHAFLNYLDDGNSALFDGGWTVASFMTQIALFLGCDPIIVVGLDLCYENHTKYGHRSNDPISSSLVEIEEFGSKKWTQPDWLMTRDWFQKISLQNETISWIDARGGKGLDLGEKFQKISLEDLKLESLGDLREKVIQTLFSLPYLEPLSKLKEWKESLLRCQKRVDFSGIDQVDESFLLRFDQEEEYEKEIAYDLLLKPMWKLWKPLYERQMQQGEKIGLHQALFFGQILEEHIRAINNC